MIKPITSFGKICLCVKLRSHVIVFGEKKFQSLNEFLGLVFTFTPCEAKTQSVVSKEHNDNTLT